MELFVTSIKEFEMATINLPNQNKGTLGASVAGNINEFFSLVFSLEDDSNMKVVLKKSNL